MAYFLGSIKGSYGNKYSYRASTKKHGISSYVCGQFFKIGVNMKIDKYLGEYAEVFIDIPSYSDNGTDKKRVVFKIDKRTAQNLMGGGNEG